MHMNCFNRVFDCVLGIILVGKVFIYLMHSDAPTIFHCTYCALHIIYIFVVFYFVLCPCHNIHVLHVCISYISIVSMHMLHAGMI